MELACGHLTNIKSIYAEENKSNFLSTSKSTQQKNVALKIFTDGWNKNSNSQNNSNHLLQYLIIRCLKYY